MSFVSVPYSAPSNLLPRDLPSHDEIHGSTVILSDVNPNRRVVQVGPFVVKYGLHVLLEEGQNMLYVESMGGVRVPRVYALFHDQQTQVNYIIMEHIQGCTLEELWCDLDTHEKSLVTCTIRRYITRMQSWKSPEVYCSLGKLPLRHDFFSDPSD